MKYYRQLNVGYHQIYIVDSSIDQNYYKYIWTNADIDSMLCVSRHFLIMATGGPLLVPFFATTYNEKPELDLSQYDHVVECSLELLSGLRIFGEFDEEEYSLSIDIKAGNYVVVACYKGLDSISFDGLEGDDSYHLFLWPSKERIPKKVLKQWVNEERGIGTGFYKE